ncbi:hypothetical protein K439DRAFT_1620835 [Ramaria rubella]|nr:hypothetical protein K439DRAFT_1620835 [Ramaria rubella]
MIIEHRDAPKAGWEAREENNWLREERGDKDIDIHRRTHRKSSGRRVEIKNQKFSLVIQGDILVWEVMESVSGDLGFLLALDLVFALRCVTAFFVSCMKPSGTVSPTSRLVCATVPSDVATVDGVTLLPFKFIFVVYRVGHAATSKLIADPGKENVPM